MSLFSIIEKTDNLIKLNVKRYTEVRKKLLLYLFVFLEALMGALIIGLSLQEMIYEKNIIYLLATPLGIAFLIFAKATFSGVTKNSSTDLIFTFDKSEKQIWVEDVASESTEDRNLVGSFSEIISIHISEQSLAHNDYFNLDNSFSVKFERDNGSLIQLYNAAIKKSATQVEKDSFLQELDRVREEVSIIQEFLSTNY